MGKKVTGNLAMSFSKICSGLNQNALRYLQPVWMDAVSGVFLRLAFAGASFWLIGLFINTEKGADWKDRVILVLMGIFLVYGYCLASSLP